MVSLIYPSTYGPVPARIVDVSKSGMRVVIDVEAKPGGLIRIEMGRLRIFGEVRNCESELNGHYAVGVLIVETTVAEAEDSPEARAAAYRP